jgi:hypothetical protein
MENPEKNSMNNKKKEEENSNGQEETQNNELIFKNLNIYVEIFNNNINQSDIMDHVLIKHGANVI